MNVRQALSSEKRLPSTIGFLRIELDERSSVISRYLQVPTFVKYISHYQKPSVIIYVLKLTIKNTNNYLEYRDHCGISDYNANTFAML